jgi:hypothetical protein
LVLRPTHSPVQWQLGTHFSGREEKQPNREADHSFACNAEVNV